MTSPSTASVNAFIGLGANLGDPVTAIAEACEALAHVGGDLGRGALRDELTQAV